MLKFTKLNTGEWRECCYIVSDSSLNAIIIDPGDDFQLINKNIILNRFNVLAILSTHAHFDHIASVQELKNIYKVPFCLHGDDFPLLSQANFYKHIFEGKKNISIPVVDIDLLLNKELQFGDINIIAIDTPGHTDGGVSFLIGGMLFVGDNLYNYKKGSTKLPGGDAEKLSQSIKKIISLDHTDLLILAGHGESMTLSNLRNIFNN